jgi:hypothetical protein
MAPGDMNDPVASGFRFPKIEHAALNEIRKAVLNYQNTTGSRAASAAVSVGLSRETHLRHVQF